MKTVIPNKHEADKDMQKNLALLAKYFKEAVQPTNNNLRTLQTPRTKLKIPHQDNGEEFDNKIGSTYSFIHGQDSGGSPAESSSTDTPLEQEVDIIKKTENQAKMTKLSME
ncbi:hypothetical protein Tco_1066307 [Tanacetum coccineum]|uniref:Uncharacterized protein n=1 Tax=Tanacetum coccineum TaxID=301880 RepID=A0ABQ5H9P4_9ASTR